MALDPWGSAEPPAVTDLPPPKRMRELLRRLKAGDGLTPDEASYLYRLAPSRS